MGPRNAALPREENLSKLGFQSRKDLKRAKGTRKDSKRLEQTQGAARKEQLAPRKLRTRKGLTAANLTFPGTSSGSGKAPMGS